ncbi:MAG: hypothetical protein RR922_04310 [Clostridia bacterium]
MDEKWNEFLNTGKVQDYLKYKLENVVGDKVNEAYKNNGDSDKGNELFR